MEGLDGQNDGVFVALYIRCFGSTYCKIPEATATDSTN